MGKVSQRLADRFRRNQRVADQFRRQMKQAGRQSEDVEAIDHLIDSGYDPMHATYVVAQNLTSLFAEEVSVFSEFKEYLELAGSAQDEYIPSAPPTSPLTLSYFTTWAFFDLPFGPDQETVGTCLLDVAETLRIDPIMEETIRRLQDSRMGIYEHCGSDGTKVSLKELLTDEEFECDVPSGYRGREHQLWYVRCCPPLGHLGDYHVVFTTPYVLLGADRSDWTAYLKRSIPPDSDDEIAAVHNFLKYGQDARTWSKYVLQGYHHHESDAIFLTGLPDVKESLPHA